MAPKARRLVLVLFPVLVLLSAFVPVDREIVGAFRWTPTGWVPHRGYACRLDVPPPGFALVPIWRLGTWYYTSNIPSVRYRVEQRPGLLTIALFTLLLAGGGLRILQHQLHARRALLDTGGC